MSIGIGDYIKWPRGEVLMITELDDYGYSAKLLYDPNPMFSSIIGNILDTRGAVVPLVPLAPHELTAARLMGII